MHKSAFVTLVALGAAFATSCAAAAAISPRQVLAHADQYNGTVISVTGTVDDFRDRVSRRGNAYETFELCGNTACLHVFAWGNAPHSDGDSVTLSGTFWTVKRVGRYTFYNELDVGS